MGRIEYLYFRYCSKLVLSVSCFSDTTKALASSGPRDKPFFFPMCCKQVTCKWYINETDQISAEMQGGESYTGTCV